MGLILLDIVNAPIGKRGLTVLTTFCFPKLEELWLRNCDIAGDGLSILVRTYWPYLRIIDLSIFLLSRFQSH